MKACDFSICLDSPGQIYGSIVPRLNDEALIELGVKSMLHRLRIISRIEDMVKLQAAAGADASARY